MMNTDLYWVVFKALRFAPGQEWRYALRRAILMRIYCRDISLAEKTGNHDKAEDINQELNIELDSLDDKRDLEITSALRAKAVRLSVAIPDLDHHKMDGTGMWKHCQSNEFLCLTVLGVETIRSAIRKEQSERHKMWAHWLSWFTAGASMIAAAASVFVAYRGF